MEAIMIMAVAAETFCCSCGDHDSRGVSGGGNFVIETIIVTGLFYVRRVALALVSLFLGRCLSDFLSGQHTFPY